MVDKKGRHGRSRHRTRAVEPSLPMEIVTKIRVGGDRSRESRADGKFSDRHDISYLRPFASKSFIPSSLLAIPSRNIFVSAFRQPRR